MLHGSFSKKKKKKEEEEEEEMVVVEVVVQCYSEDSLLWKWNGVE